MSKTQRLLFLALVSFSFSVYSDSPIYYQITSTSVRNLTVEGLCIEGESTFSPHAQYSYSYHNANFCAYTSPTFGPASRSYEEKTCPLEHIFSESSNECIEKPELIQCAEIGYNAQGFYPDGFCPNLPDNTASSTHAFCQASESEVPVPSCTLTKCPDGSIINSSLNSCPNPRQCWDGSTTYGDFECPDPPFICPDGSQAPNALSCIESTSDTHECSDGSIIPLTQLCLQNEFVTCSDGSQVTDASTCPIPTATTFTCLNGQVVQESSQCPVINPIPTTVTNTSFSTSTTNVYDENGVQTGTEVTTTESDYSPITSRQDKAFQQFKEFVGNPSDYSFDYETQLDSYSDLAADESLALLNNSPNDFIDLPYTSSSDWFYVPESSGCTGSIDTTIFGRPFVIAPCEKLEPLRTVLAWVFSFMAMLSVIRTTFSIHRG